jgi:hypothetical protein
MQSTLVLIGAALLAAPGPELLGREDFRITTDDGIGIAVREVHPLRVVTGAIHSFSCTVPECLESPRSISMCQEVRSRLTSSG